MDSGSSGSLQSSSGGEEEHDSRAQPFSAGLVGPIIPNPPPKHLPFDPFSNFFHPLPTNPIQSQSVMPTTITINPIQVQVPPNDHLQPHPPPPTRNPRKRTRASRRAPTTVLTTDTSNFRAMVQEFTGIPPPPFTPASPFSKPRLDSLFGGPSTSTTPPYLLRPFPQKLSPFLSPPPPSSDFLLPKHNHPNHPIPSIFNLHPNTNLHVTQTTPEPNRNPLHLPEDQLLLGNVRDGGSGGGNVVPASWGSGSDEAVFRSMNAKYSSGTKLNSNFSASSSSSNLDFHGDNKGSENVTNRSEGMIESWICSSD